MPVLFFSVRERIYHPKPSLGMAAQFRLLIKNDQWLILGAVIAIIMFGGIIRNSVAAYYAKILPEWWGCFNFTVFNFRRDRLSSGYDRLHGLLVSMTK